MMTNTFITMLASLLVSVIPMPQSVELGDRPSDAAKVTTKICRSMEPEAYSMKIGPHRIKVKAGSEAGIFYALQTLEQLKASGELTCGKIEDVPRFSWRGYMLDESRHFFGEEYVKRVLDMMARYKLNKFHWHLTDAPGWRIEIKKYPLLTTIGGVGNYSDPNAPAQFYTQEQIRDIVEYASARHIEVIPEIDMPGHASAANRAYPEYSGGGTTIWPHFTFNPGKEETYSFLMDILREIKDLFPSKYMHLGCDEVHFVIDVWNEDPWIQGLMKRENLETVEDAEWYFLRRMSDSLTVLDRKMIVWDDAFQADADPERTTFTWWRHDKETKPHDMAQAGYDIILCPRIPLYYDFVQKKEDKVGRVWKDGTIATLDKVYSFPDGVQLSEEDMPHVLGMQANLWSELVATTQRAEYLTFPRLIAMAEAAWTSPENKDWESFQKRLVPEYSLMDSLGIYYFDARNPADHPEPAR